MQNGCCAKFVFHQVSCCCHLIFWISFVLTQAAILAKDYLKHYHFLGRMLGKVWLASIVVTALSGFVCVCICLALKSVKLVKSLLRHVSKNFIVCYLFSQALYENMLVELPFASFFLCKLLSKHGTDVDIHHLESLDPEMYRYDV